MAKKRKINPQPSYTLVVTDEQAAVLCDACELLSRTRIGQIWAALDRLPIAAGQLMVPHDARIVVEQTLSPYVGFDMTRQSLGIRNEKTDASGKIAFYLYQLIRHRLSWDKAIEDGIVAPDGQRDWSKMIGVNYDEPMPFGDFATIAKEVAR